MMAAQPLPFERHHDESGATPEPTPPPQVVRYECTRRLLCTCEAPETYWGFKLSDYQRVAYMLPQLTPDELERVWVAIAELVDRRKSYVRPGC